MKFSELKEPSMKAEKNSVKLLEVELHPAVICHLVPHLNVVVLKGKGMQCEIAGGVCRVHSKRAAELPRSSVLQ